ncbi:hypothetical protein F5Y06DRAFT_281506 [Hypoxylon sp. FL0890]|nr:hypothetical protein F5Y06DRAFT_281506 [Hypoxylon sp. FL0890]
MKSKSVQLRTQAAARAALCGMPVRQAARKWDIPRTTLQRRLDGIPTCKEVNIDQQALSPYIEAQLASWAIGQARLGYAPTFVTFRKMAQQMATAAGSSKPLGPIWYPNFLDRNADFRSVRSNIIN